MRKLLLLAVVALGVACSKNDKNDEFINVIETGDVTINPQTSLVIGGISGKGAASSSKTVTATIDMNGSNYIGVLRNTDNNAIVSTITPITLTSAIGLTDLAYGNYKLEVYHMLLDALDGSATVHGQVSFAHNSNNTQATLDLDNEFVSRIRVQGTYHRVQYEAYVSNVPRHTYIQNNNSNYTYINTAEGIATRGNGVPGFGQLPEYGPLGYNFVAKSSSYVKISIFRTATGTPDVYYLGAAPNGQTAIGGLHPLKSYELLYADTAGNNAIAGNAGITLRVNDIELVEETITLN